MSRNEMVKIIRAELKEKGINNRQVSVTSRSALYDDSITATIKDLKVPFSVVEQIVNKYESIRYDEYNGEILSGCNVYVNVSFDYEAVRNERENYMSLAQEIIEKYKDTPEGQLEVLARKGDVEIFYTPNPHYCDGKVVEVCRIVNQELHNHYGEFYHSINNIERYNAHNDYAIAEAMVYIANQYDIDFFAPIPELNEDDLQVICIPEEEKEYKARAEQESKKFKETEQKVKTIQPLKVENIEDKNIRIEVKFPSLNKQNTISEYQEELLKSYNTNVTLICEVITLSNSDYELFTNNLLSDCDFIAGKGGNRSDFETNKENIWELTEKEMIEYRGLSYTLGILVQNEDGQQIIVDPQGYNYSRYVGFLVEPFTTPEPPKPTTKNNKIKNETNSINNSNDNIINLASYKANKTVSVTQSTNIITDDEKATKKQLYALHVGSKLNTTNLIISKTDASRLIKLSMKGNNIHDQIKQLLESQELNIAK